MEQKIENIENETKKIIVANEGNPGVNDNAPKNAQEENISKNENKSKKRQKKIKYPTYDSMNEKYNRAQKKKINPNLPLPNPKHEMVARKLASGANKKESYNIAYNNNVPRTNSHVTAHPNIKARYIALLEQHPSTSTAGIHKKLTELLDSKRAVTLSDSIVYVNDNGTQLETAKTILKMQGALENGLETPQKTTNITVVDAQILGDILCRIERTTEAINSLPVSGIIDISPEISQ